MDNDKKIFSNFACFLILVTMIKENLEKIRATLPKSVTLVAVSKTKPVSD